MAYKNIVSVSCASTIEVFRHVKDFLLKRSGIVDYSVSGIGWTLHDSYFASADQDDPAEADWIVLYSTGEDGKQDLYYRIVLSTVAQSILRTDAGLYWNTSTDAWVRGMPTSIQSAGPTSGTTFGLSIYGDLSSFSIILGNGTTLHGRYFGLLDDPMHDPTVATVAGTITAGSAVVVSVDAVPTTWSTGNALFLRGPEEIEKVIISTISGTDVTLTTVANSYATGAKLARDYPVCVTNGGFFVQSTYCALAKNGTNFNASLNSRFDNNILNDNDPDRMNDCHITEYSKAGESTYGGYFGRHRNILRVSTTGITSGTVYTDDDTGDNWRALSINATSATMYLIKEV